MKLIGVCILILATGGSMPFVRAEQAPEPTAEKDYAEFLSALAKPENLIDFAEKSDRLVDAGEKAEEEAGGGQNVVRTETKIGLAIDFAVIRSPIAVMYYAALSRNGQPLRYSEAATLLAFFCDRIGITHPVEIKEGEKPVFHAEWLIKPSEWKAMRKKMLEVRAVNRGEKDVVKALRKAVNAEMAARMAMRSQGPQR